MLVFVNDVVVVAVAFRRPQCFRTTSSSTGQKLDQFESFHVGDALARQWVHQGTRIHPNRRFTIVVDVVAGTATMVQEMRDLAKGAVVATLG